MSTTLQFRRGNTAVATAVTGADGEIYINTQTKTIHVHDGSTAGGFALANASALSSYQTMGGLSSNVATLTANNTSFVGSVSAANVVSNTQLQSNLANYGALAGATFTGNVTFNANVSVGSGTLYLNGKLFANNSTGTAGQVLKTDGIGYTYWANDAVGSGGSGSADFSQVAEDIIPMLDSVYDLGTANSRWHDAYVGNKIDINGAQLSGVTTGSVGSSNTTTTTVELTTTQLQSPINTAALGQDEGGYPAGTRFVVLSMGDPNNLTSALVAGVEVDLYDEYGNLAGTTTLIGPGFQPSYNPNSLLFPTNASSLPYLGMMGGTKLTYNTTATVVIPDTIEHTLTTVGSFVSNAIVTDTSLIGSIYMEQSTITPVVDSTYSGTSTGGTLIVDGDLTVDGDVALQGNTTVRIPLTTIGTVVSVDSVPSTLVTTTSNFTLGSGYNSSSQVQTVWGSSFYLISDGPLAGAAGLKMNNGSFYLVFYNYSLASAFAQSTAPVDMYLTYAPYFGFTSDFKLQIAADAVKSIASEMFGYYYVSMNSSQGATLYDPNNYAGQYMLGSNWFPVKPATSWEYTIGGQVYSSGSLGSIQMTLDTDVSSYSNVSSYSDMVNGTTNTSFISTLTSITGNVITSSNDSLVVAVGDAIKYAPLSTTLSFNTANGGAINAITAYANGTLTYGGLQGSPILENTTHNKIYSSTADALYIANTSTINSTSIGAHSQAGEASVAIGHWANGSGSYAVTVGQFASQQYNSWGGVALGYQATASIGGIGIGYYNLGSYQGVSIGQQAQGGYGGVAIGASAYTGLNNQKGGVSINTSEYSNYEAGQIWKDQISHRALMYWTGRSTTSGSTYYLGFNSDSGWSMSTTESSSNKLTGDQWLGKSTITYPYLMSVKALVGSTTDATLYRVLMKEYLITSATTQVELGTSHNWSGAYSGASSINITFANYSAGTTNKFFVLTGMPTASNIKITIQVEVQR